MHGSPRRRWLPCLQVSAVVEEKELLVGGADAEGREAEVGGGVHSQDVDANEGVVVFWALVVVPERRVRRSMAEQKMAAAAAGT